MDPWACERPVSVSTLPASARLVARALLSRTDSRTAVVPDDHSPSLTGLSEMTGLDRTTVARMLRVLEGDGWVHRIRPPVEQSRRGARTGYRLDVPSGTTPLGSGTTPLGVVAPDRTPSGTTPPRSDLEPNSIRARPRTRAREAAESTVQLACECTSIEAAAIVDLIESDRQPKQIAGYVRSMARAPTAFDAYLARVRANGHAEPKTARPSCPRHPGQLAHNCSGCRADLLAGDLAEAAP